jgi:hypothetical protein
MESIRRILMAAHNAGEPMSSATKGREREAFVEVFLKATLPPPFRFGSGEITDYSGHTTGQLDIVVESPYSLALSVLGGPERLFLAEGVAAAIEVKSDLKKQWLEVGRAAMSVLPLNRAYRTLDADEGNEFATVPFFAVGYRGWSTPEQLQLRTPPVRGMLVLEHSLYVSYSDRTGGPRKWSVSRGPSALLAFALDVYRHVHSLRRAVLETEAWGLKFEGDFPANAEPTRNRIMKALYSSRKR